MCINCMRVCLYVFVCVRVFVLYIYMFVYICTRAYMYTQTQTYRSIYMYTHIHICIHIIDVDSGGYDERCGGILLYCNSAAGILGGAHRCPWRRWYRMDWQLSQRWGQACNRGGGNGGERRRRGEIGSKGRGEGNRAIKGGIPSGQVNASCKRAR